LDFYVREYFDGYEDPTDMELVILIFCW